MGGGGGGEVSGKSLGLTLYYMTHDLNLAIILLMGNYTNLEGINIVTGSIGLVSQAID